MSDAEINSYNILEAQLTQVLGSSLIKIPDGVKSLTNTLNLQWKNKLAIQRVYQISMFAGRSPDSVDPTLGGEVMWKNVKSRAKNQEGEYGRYHRIYIRDEFILHTKPVAHADFLHAYIYMRMYPEKAKLIGDISNSAAYHGSEGSLESVCGEIEANIATFAVMKVLNYGLYSTNQLREWYNFIVKACITEYFENEKKASSEGHNNPYKLNAPIRDALEAFVFSTDNRAGWGVGAGLLGGLLLGGIGGALLGGLAGAATLGPAIATGAVIGGGIGLAAGAANTSNNPNRDPISKPGINYFRVHQWASDNNYVISERVGIRPNINQNPSGMVLKVSPKSGTGKTYQGTVNITKTQILTIFKKWPNDMKIIKKPTLDTMKSSTYDQIREVAYTKVAKELGINPRGRRVGRRRGAIVGYQAGKHNPGPNHDKVLDAVNDPDKGLYLDESLVVYPTTDSRTSYYKVEVGPTVPNAIVYRSTRRNIDDQEARDWLDIDPSEIEEPSELTYEELDEMLEVASLDKMREDAYTEIAKEMGINLHYKKSVKSSKSSKLPQSLDEINSESFEF